MHNRWFLFFSMSFSLSSILSFQSENVCMFQDSCERCLSADYQCAWCSDKKYQMRYRCLTQQQLLKYGCSSKQIWENDPQMKILKDIALTDYLNDNDSAIQMRPQKVFVKLIKSHPQRLKLTYRPARNNPLDLYYLMDLTWTMRDDKATLVTMGAQLAEALRNLTINYRLGFGSFADKPAMPMIMPHLRDNPCISELIKCEPTYSYRHHLALTEAIGDFVHSVNSSQITGNLDNLEGGLDALMQVLVCTDRIGWKTSARKIVILVTDGYMHFAGDGILAGVTRRNDKSCHLNANGEHLTSLEYDYPSLEEIYRELLKRKINIIFAVTEAVVDTYRELSGLMQEVSNVEILSTDSSNILELIKKSYESFIKRAQFFDDSPSFIRIDYETDCGGQFRTLRQRSYCNNVEMGKEVDFYINLTLIDFPKNGIYIHKVRIEESSLSEFLEFHIEIQKPCPCSEGNNLFENEDNSSGVNKGSGDIGENDEDKGRFQCSGNGNMHCGMCNCDEGWTGTYCNCPTNTLNLTTNDALEKMCRQRFTNPSEWGPVCSNRGECDCGSCFCFPGYSGKYCECPNCGIDCDLERADCLCGRCVCKEGWSGSQCRCRETNDGCIGPTGEICSERGTCECNECICKESYLGRFCEIGAESENKLCNFYESCVTCLIEEKFPNSIKSSCANLSSVCSTAEELERFTYAFVTDELDSDIRCLVRLESKDGLKCDHYFTYRSLGYSQNYLLIQANTCEAVNYYAFIGYVSSLTFLIGLATICLIMFCIRLKDEREYARFMADQRFSTLSESPIYKNPVIEYQVPKQLIEDKNLNPFKM